MLWLVAFFAFLLAAAGLDLRRAHRFRAWRALHAAWLSHDHLAVAEGCRGLLARGALPDRTRELLRVQLASALHASGDGAAALATLDEVHLRALQPIDVALWLNNRAYLLALTGHPDEALQHLDDATDLLVGDDASPARSSLAACIRGTRGIALYQGGALEAAELALRDALRLGEESARAASGQLGSDGERALNAERWWWLAAIARSRGDEASARAHLAEAASHAATEYGGRAAAALRALATAPAPLRLGDGS